MPGGAQSVIPGAGSMQVQPAFMSVTSVTPRNSVDAFSPEETSPADDWPSTPCAGFDAIALGPDGDPQAPINNPANTTNTVHARLNIFDMLTQLGWFRRRRRGAYSGSPTGHPHEAQRTIAAAVERHEGQEKIRRLP